MIGRELNYCLRFLKKEIFCKDHKIKLYSVKNNNLKKLLLISGDYGTYNPFNIIADRLEKYGIQTTHLNMKDLRQFPLKD